MTHHLNPAAVAPARPVLPAALLTLSANELVNMQIYHALRRAIVNCTLLPGQAISDKEISELFGVSRQPVRDAFIKLASAGLIQVLPQRGTFVKKISPKRVLNGRFLREAVETAVVGRAAEQIGEDQLLRLASLLDLQRAAAARNDTEGFLELDEEFHSFISRCIDCVEAWDMIENTKAQMDRVRYLSLAADSPPSLMIDQHQVIYDALATRCAEQAQAAMRAHLRELALTFGPIRERNPDWFEAE